MKRANMAKIAAFSLALLLAAAPIGGLGLPAGEGIGIRASAEEVFRYKKKYSDLTVVIDDSGTATIGGYVEVMLYSDELGEAFSKYNVKKLVFESDVTILERFFPCDIEEVVLPRFCTIASEFFKDCTSLKKISFSAESYEEGHEDAYLEIYNNAFSGCTSLKEIYLPRSGKAKPQAFEGSSIEKIYVDKDMLNDEYYEYYLSNFNLTAADVTGSCPHSEINEDGICGTCGYMIINDGKTAVINKKTVSEGICMLSGDDDTAYIRGSGVIPDNCELDTEMKRKIVIEEGITGIGNSGFASGGWAEEVVLPESLKTIGDNAFYRFYGLDKINFPEGLESIGEYAFRECRLRTVELPAGTKLSKNAFFKTDTDKVYVSEEKMKDPDYVSMLTGAGFAKRDLKACNHKKINGKKCSYCGKAFIASWQLSPTVYAAIDSDYTLYITGEGAMPDIELRSQEEFPWEEGYKDKIKKVIICDGITHVGARAFYWNEAITDIILPDNLQSIGAYAFAYCLELRHISPLPEGMTRIEDGTFQWCRYMEEITIPSTVETIGREAFTHCFTLKDIKLPVGLKKAEHFAFELLANDETGAGLTQITIPNTLEELSGGAVFQGCAYLTKVYYDMDCSDYDSKKFEEFIMGSVAPNLWACDTYPEFLACPHPKSEIKSKVCTRCGHHIKDSDIISVEITANGVSAKTRGGDTAVYSADNVTKIMAGLMTDEQCIEFVNAFSNNQTSAILTEAQLYAIKRVIAADRGN